MRRLIAELELDQRKGKLLPADEVGDIIGVAFGLAKSLLRGLPRRMAAIVAPMHEPAKIEARLADEIDAGLQATADVLEQKGLRAAAIETLARGEALNPERLAAMGVQWSPSRPSADA